jgi:SPP1 gp7 family putative phage head morphogenesis protein
MPSDLKARIRAATLKSLKARDLYTARMTAQLTRALKQAKSEVATALRSYKSLGSLPENKLAGLKGLEKLQGEIAETMKRLRREQTLAYRKSTKEAFGLGIAAGIGELADAALPFYADLGADGIDKLATQVFQIVDTDALDFMTQYNLTLAGDVQRELSDGIKRTILSGIATGKGSDDLVRDLGEVIEDKESFRQAGTKVFSKAQYRMETIARTEVLRAHNMGRLKFHQRVGIQKLEWMAVEDERMCAVCGGLDGQVFEIGKFPQQPAHPLCRCVNQPAWPLVICEGELSAQAAPTEPQGDACILPPHVLEGMADAEAAENAALKAAFETGNLQDLQALTMAQVKKLAKQNGVSVARTKAEHLALLDLAEPGVDHSGLAGAALQAHLAQYKIGALRTKPELVALLAQKQTAFQQAQLAAQQMAQATPLPGLEGMTVSQLKEMAKGAGISLNMTKQDTVDLLDQIEPGVDHSGLSGKDLVLAKMKHGIGVLKNKQQLVQSLQKHAGQQLAQKAQQETQQAALQKIKAKIQESVAGVVIPPNPADFPQFLASVKQAEGAFSEGGLLGKEDLAGFAESLAAKKQIFQSQIASMKSGDLKTLAKETKVSHWQWGTKEDFVTLFTETDPAKVAAVQAKLDAGYQAHQAKYKKGAQTAPPPEAKPPIPKPQPKTETPPPQPVQKGSEFENLDGAWAEKVKGGQFTLTGRAEVGGAHEKEFWTDEQGRKWLFKPQRKGDEFIAEGEEAAYKIGRLLDPHAIEVRTIRLGGRTGSIQPWRTDLKEDFDFRSTLPEHLTTLELEQIQREHVLDWLVANHDGHAKQFVRTRDGHVYGIDKGQAFKFLGQDKLSLDYHPNRAFGEQEPYYHTVFRAAKAGKLQFDPSATLRAIEQVEQVSDDAYLALLRPYAEGRFGSDKIALQHFYDQALARKHNLRRDFEAYYGDVLGDSGFRFSQAAPSGKRFTDTEEAILREAETLGWQGKTLPLDLDDIEDQNALVFTETWQGQKRTVLKFKLRPEADARVLAGLSQGNRIGAAKEIGKPLGEDAFYADILGAVKTINHHQQDGQYNAASIEKALKHRSALTELLKHGDPDVRGMAKGYLDWLGEIDQARQARRRTKGDLTQYLRRSEPALKKSEAAFTVRKGGVENTLRALEKGTIRVQDDAASNSDLFRGHSMKKGEQYTATFPDGTRVRYRPWSDQNLYAQRGEIEVTLPKAASSDEIADALERLEGLGVNASQALPEHAEWMYLRKMAYVAKEDTIAPYRKTLEELEKRGAAVTERVQTLRDYWQKRLGVRDLTRMPGYAPLGEYQQGFLDRKLKGGYRQQYRFDLSEADLEREMKGYALYHQVTGGTHLDTFIETILENNGAMVSTVEKMRIGVAPGGMSPAADMDTGGASYFFTRLKKLPPQGRPTTAGLYFKKQLLRRMDAVSYDHDAFGRVTDDYVRRRRGSQPAEWKQFAKARSNETIFKYSVTLLDNIETIVTGSPVERERVLKSFLGRGITALPDGRKIADVVISA